MNGGNFLGCHADIYCKANQTLGHNAVRYHGPKQNQKSGHIGELFHVQVDTKVVQLGSKSPFCRREIRSSVVTYARATHPSRALAKRTAQVKGTDGLACRD
jgi:hypothetical protein